MSYIGNIWRKLSHVGTDEGMDFQLQHRVILSNRLGVIISAVVLIFSIVVFSKGNGTLLLLGIILMVSLGIIVLNRFRFHGFSRLLVSLIPAIGILWVNLSIKLNHPETIEIIHYISPRMVIVSSLVLPFTLFATKEKWLLGTGLLIIMACAVGYDALHTVLGIHYEQFGIESKYYSVVYEDMFVVMVMLLSSSVFLFNLNNQYEKKNAKLFQEAHDKNAEAVRNEEELKKTLKEIEVARVEDDKRNWATTGLAEIAVLLQSKVDGTELYDRLISKIVNYTNINQGGLYVINDDDPENITIDLTAAYAYNRKKFMESSYKIGQGLIGQTYLEGETCYLKEVPQGYITITSGLGETTPSYVLIVPLKINDKIEGIIELASFNGFEPHHIKFLEKAGEAIASSIATTKVTSKTEELLSSSQQMTEEMRAQEEEMRQNMEELSATQEEMSRKEREYIAKIEELEAQLAEVQRK